MKKLSLLILLITIVGILPSIVQYGCFIMATDMADQEVPFIIETKRMLMSGSPLWSWNHDFGDNFIGSYTFYTLTSPFVWINCLFPDRWMLAGITFTLLLKMLCTGWAALAYLRRMSVSKEASVVGALMYAFSSYALSNLFYYHFLEPMMVFPLLLIAIERYLCNERYSRTGMVLASFLVFFINYYFAACSMIAAALYAVCRMCSKGIHASAGKATGGLLLVCIGLLLSSFVLLPTVMHLQGNPRQAGDVSELYHALMSSIERLYTLFVPKVVEGTNTAFYYYPFSSNAASVPVVGLLLAGLYTMRHHDWLSLLVVLAVACYITPLNGLFSLFTNPGYTRWAYALTLFVILASMKLADEHQPLKMRHCWNYAAICCMALAVSYGVGMYLNHKNHGSAYDNSAIMVNSITLAMFLLQMLLLLAYAKHNTTATLLRCVVVMSMVHFPVRVLMNTDAMNRNLYNTEKRGSIRQYQLENRLPRHNGNFKWRTDFMAQYHNVSMAKNRPAVATFNSIQNNKLSRLLQAIGCQMGCNTVRAFKNVVSLDALMSVKEIIEYDNYRHWCQALKVREPSREPCLTDKRDKAGYTVYDNKYYIPMGFTYDSFIRESAIDSMLATDKQADVPLQLLANLAVPDSLLALASSVLEPGELRHGLSIDSVVTQRRKVVCSSFTGDTQGFKATVDMPRRNLLFFSVVSDKGFKARVDGIETAILPVNLGLSAIMVDEGKHNVEFKYVPPGLYHGLLLTLAGLLLTLIVILTDIKTHTSKS